MGPSGSPQPLVSMFAGRQEHAVGSERLDDHVVELVEEVFDLMDNLTPNPGNGMIDVKKGKTWSVEVMDMTPEEWERDTQGGGCSGLKMWKLRVAEISKFGCEEESEKQWFDKASWVAYHRQLTIGN